MARRNRETRPSVREVLSGATAVELGDLFALIHEVNPTGRAVAQRDEKARYELKARLQSLLVVRFGDRLAFDPAGPGLVSIRHATLGVDACHAIIAELEPDARSLVQRALDEAADTRQEVRASGQRKHEKARGEVSSAASSSSDDRDDADRLWEGRRALDEYDYELARSHFEAAFAAARGSVEAARALLGLYVDHLADDATAIAMAGRLDATVRRDPGVRVYLGLACGRQGDLTACENWLEGATEEGAADGWFAALESALIAGDAASATRFLDRGIAVAPTHLRVVELRGRVAGARAAGLARAEADLDAHVETVESEDAAAHARAVSAGEAVLAQYPESRKARSLIAAVEARRSALRQAKVLRQARDHAARGDLPTASTLLRAEIARVVGPELSTWRAELTELERRLGDARREAQLSEVLSALEDPARPPAQAVALFLTLPAAQRAIVRRAHDRPALAFAEEALDAGATHAIAAGVGLLIEDVRGCVGIAPAETLAKLRRDEAVVRTVREGRRLVEEARAACRAEDRARASGALEHARGLLSKGQGRAAGEVLAAIRDADLDEPARPELIHLRDRALASASIEELERDLERARAEGAVFDAIDAAVRLSASAHDQRRPGLAATLAELRAEASQRYRVATLEGGFEGWYRHFGGRRSAVECTISDDGRELVVAWGASSVACVHRVDIATGRALATMTFDTHGPLRRGLTVWGSSGFVLEDLGAIYQIDLNELRLRRVHEAWTAAPGELDDLAVVLDEEPYRWIKFRDERCRITRLSRKDSVREIDGVFMFFELVMNGREVVVVLRGRSERAQLYTASGRSLGVLELGSRSAGTVGHTFEGGAAHPDGTRIAALVADRGDDLDGGPLLLCACAPGRACGPMVPLSESDGTMMSAIASSSDQGLVFVVFAIPTESCAGAFCLSAFAPQGDSFREVWSVPWSGAATLATDRASRSVFAWEARQDGLSIVELTATPPEPRTPPPAASPRMWTDPIHACGPPYGDAKVRVSELAVKFAAIGNLAARELAEQMLARQPLDPQVHLDVAHALRGAHDRELGLACVVERFPQHPEARLAVADRAASRGDWDTVEAHLPEALELPAAYGPHRDHLEGLLAAVRGRFDDARVILARLDGVPGIACDARGVLDHLEEIEVALAGHGDPDSIVGWLALALAKADPLIESARFEDALAALDSTPLYGLGELQFLARVSECLLSLPVRDDRDRVRRRLVLSRFVEALGSGRGRRRECILPRMWRTARLMELEKRAVEWLATWP